MAKGMLSKVMKYELRYLDGCGDFQNMQKELWTLQRQSREILNRTIQIAYHWDYTDREKFKKTGQHLDIKAETGYRRLDGYIYDSLKEDVQNFASVNVNATIQKAWANVKQKFGWGQSSGSLTGAAASITGDADTGSILSTLTGQATGLSDALLNATNPAISSTITGLGGMASSAIDAGMGVANVASPAVSAAGSIASMATAAPIAAAGLGAMAAVMTIASSAFTTAAPALTTMAGAMASLAASASTAATAMAALAVATAAESVAKIPFVGGFLAPLAATLTGAGIAAGAAMAGGGQMIGGAMSGLGNKLSGVSSLSKSTNVVPHAKGGIVSSPTMFPMQGGNVGLAGEAGTEVIAPAKRMANGDVGIGAVAPQVTINNYTNAAVEVKRRPDNSTEIKIAELNSMLASSRSNKGMVAAQSRLQKQGRQIG